MLASTKPDGWPTAACVGQGLAYLSLRQIVRRKPRPTNLLTYATKKYGDGDSDSSCLWFFGLSMGVPCDLTDQHNTASWRRPLRRALLYGHRSTEEFRSCRFVGKTMPIATNRQLCTLMRSLVSFKLAHRYEPSPVACSEDCMRRQHFVLGRNGVDASTRTTLAPEGLDGLLAPSRSMYILLPRKRLCSKQTRYPYHFHSMESEVQLIVTMFYLHGFVIVYKLADLGMPRVPKLFRCQSQFHRNRPFTSL